MSIDPREPDALATVVEASAQYDLQRIPGPWLQMFRPAGIEWNRITLGIPSLSDRLVGLRILHITDLHLRGRWMAALEPVLHRIADDPPDLLICTGDFVENRRKHAPAMPFVRRLVEGFSARLGCFAVMGNHDGKLADDLNEPHLMLLDNRQHAIRVDEAKIELIGLPRLAKHEPADPALVPDLPSKASGDLRIVLSHHPDYLPMTRKLQPDLFLTGHTHGGQVCLPGGWPIIKHCPLPRRLCRGIHAMSSNNEGRDRSATGMPDPESITYLIANRGIGFSGLPIRLFCPGEVVELVLSRSVAAW